MTDEAEKAAEEYANSVVRPYNYKSQSMDEESALRVDESLRGLAKAAYLAGRADALRWIPVTERLPEDSEYCLVSIGDERRIARELFCADINGGGDFMVSRVTHWMPLPPAPEGEG